MFIGIILILSGGACNKANNATLKSASNSETPATLQQKVLFVVVDGAMGTEMRAAAPPVLTGLTSHSIYSWNSLTGYTDDDVTNPSTWTTLLTGVNDNKHLVTNSLSTADLTNYPTIFERLKTANASLRTVGLTSVDSLKTALLGAATSASSFGGDDAATNTAALEEIKNNDPDLLLVQYHAVDAAGTANSYSAVSPAYKSALLQIDTYIGQLVNAIQDRDNYANENWLVIITSNKGSNTALPSGGNWSAFDDARHNTFTFYYNPRFVPKITAKPTGIIPYAGVVPSYTIGGSNSQSNPTYAATAAPNTIVFDSLGDYTIQCKVKFPADQTKTYPGFLGTSKYRYTYTPTQSATSPGGGWVAYFETATQYYVNVFTRSGPRSQYLVGGNVVDGKWHTIDIVFQWNSEKTVRNGYAVTDGVAGAAKDVKSAALSVVDNPFTVGYKREDPGDHGTETRTGVFITDVRIYNTALPTSYILANYCSTVVPDNDPYKGNLLGFWPSLDAVTDGTNFYLRDISGKGNYLKLYGYNRASFSEQTTNVCPAVSESTYKSVPNSVDAVPFIFSWLNIPVSSSWQLDGQTWVPTYNDLIN